MHCEPLGRTKACPVGVAVSHVASLPAFRQTWALLWPVWLPKCHLYGCLTNFAFARGCDSRNKPENVQLQSEHDPDSWYEPHQLSTGFFSKGKPQKRLQCQNLLCGFKKCIVYLTASVWTQTHLKIQSSIHILLQSPIAPVNLTTENFDVDRKLSYFL